MVAAVWSASPWCRKAEEDEDEECYSGLKKSGSREGRSHTTDYTDGRQKVISFLHKFMMNWFYLSTGVPFRTSDVSDQTRKSELLKAGNG